MKNELEIQKAIDYVVSKKEGTLLPHSEFRKIMGLSYPERDDFDSTEEHYQAYKDQDFVYMGFMVSVADTLLKKHNICLNNIKGAGYVVLPPKEQINYGLSRSKKGVYKQLKRGKNILLHVDRERLDSETLRKAADGIASLSRLKQFTRRAGL